MCTGLKHSLALATARNAELLLIINHHKPIGALDTLVFWHKLYVWEQYFQMLKKTIGQLNFVIVFPEFTFDFCHNIILKEKKKEKKKKQFHC